MSYLTITKFLNLISKHYLLPCNLDRSKKVAASVRYIVHSAHTNSGVQQLGTVPVRR